MNNAEDILEELMKDPEVAEKIQIIQQSIVTPELQNLADYMHSLFCSANHEFDCAWYSEKGIINVWQDRYHSYWLDLARAYVQERPQESFGDLRVRLQKVSEFKEFIKSWTKTEYALSEVKYYV